MLGLLAIHKPLRAARSTIKELRQNRQIGAYLAGVQRRQRPYRHGHRPYIGRALHIYASRAVRRTPAHAA
jgi:hypothetical protein